MPQKKKTHKVLRVTGACLGCLLIFVGFLAYYSAKWYADTYGQLGFEAILYTLLADLGGVESTLIYKYVRSALIPSLFWTALLCPVLFGAWRKKLMLVFPKRKLQLFPMRPVVSLVLTLAISGSFFYRGAETAQFWDYIKNLGKQSTLYTDHYQDPATADITFPQEKRNLIYIFLESMETTFFSREQGGLMDTSVIPELYDLAENHINFSNSENTVGGIRSGMGGVWTVAAMVSQTAGLPLKAPPDVVDGNSYGVGGVFLPGATSMMDILHENGYYQTLMVGSDASFGGRSTYFGTHGVDKIYDLFTAREDGLIAPDYKVWWGFEDNYLFRYAKQELTKIAEKEEPFAFYMLTVDTHHEDGYLCPDCPNTFPNKYENVYACSSKKTAAFIQWIQAQDFYKDTTVVVVGDHPTMGNDYIRSIKKDGDENYPRDVYNCFINSVAKPVNTTNRMAFTLDMFPTTLAAMGCQIDGERLGLGTNLFSDRKTLGEELGSNGLNDQLNMPSNYYTSTFYFEKKK